MDVSQNETWLYFFPIGIFEVGHDGVTSCIGETMCCVIAIKNAASGGRRLSAGVSLERGRV